MIFTRWVARGATVVFATTVAASTAFAQGATTGGITGIVVDSAGKPLENAQIEVVNPTTGYRTGQVTRANGRYYVQNLEVGPGYNITARLIGYAPSSQTNVRVTLNQTTRADFQMRTQAAQLTAVTIEGTRENAIFSPTRQGASTTINDTLIRRIPTLNRDVADLVKLTPQVTTTPGQGPSAAGGFNRFNSFTVDGANQSDRFNLGSTGGTPGGSTGGRIIPIDAVKEVTVNLSPTDVRLGNFAGLNVNAVTRSGTNTFTGGATYTFRNPSLAYDTSFIKTGDLNQKQFGFNVGGPILRDKLHFFVASEWQERTQPNAGPLVGPTPTDAINGITRAQIDRVIGIARDKYGFDAGSPDLLKLETPLLNFMGRLDWQANDQTRFVFRQLVNKADQVDFSRNNNSFNNAADVQNSGYRLTSNQVPRKNRNYSSVLQAFTNWSTGVANEFSASFNRITDVRTPPVQTPEISIAAGASAITFGTEQFSPINDLKQNILELTDNVTVPMGAHTLTFGGRFEYNRFFNDFRQRFYGSYKFANIDSFDLGRPGTYSVGYSNGASIPADFRTQMFSGYVQDQWSARQNLTVTGGLRIDVPRMPDTPPYNPSLYSAFQQRGVANVNTAAKPKTRPLFSPRLGVNWDVFGNQSLQVRGNTGIFTGQPPYVMVGNAYQNTGMQLVFLNCTNANATTRPPAFTADVDALPRACAGQTPPQAGAAGTAGVNLNDPNFKFPQRFFTTLGIDKRLPYGFVFTGEALYGKDIHGLWIRDINILGPRFQADGSPVLDPNGRILYGTITENAAGTNPQGNNIAVNNNAQRALATFNGVTFSEGAIYLTNQSKAYNYALSGQLRKRFSDAVDASAAYTYTRSKDVQSLTSDRAISNWRNGRQYADLENAQTLGTSAFERRHRVVAFGTYTAPWKRFATDVSLQYEGTSGAPITYTANGDLNGDGFNGNDPLYIPRNATDSTEVRIVRLQDPSRPFNGAPASNTASNWYVWNAEAAQQFENFIGNQSCLNDQRGQIMERNSCRAPWRNVFNLSLRQSLPEVRGQRFTAQLDIFNFANLLNKDWGRIDEPTLSPTFPQQQALLTRGVQTVNGTPLIEYEFDTRLTTPDGKPNPFQVAQNSFASLYQMQLTFRYSF